MKKNNKFKSWWIIGLLIPFIGLIVYFCNKGMDKDTKSNLFTGTIIGFGLWLFVGLSFLIKVNEPVVVEPKEYTISQWLIDTEKQEEPVVTVIGMTSCGHCQKYKPVIESLAEQYGFNLYFFEIDTFEYNDATTLETTFELTEYSNSVPFTFIVKDGEVIAQTTGFENKAETVKFLTQNGILK